MAIKMVCLECGEKFELEDWEDEAFEVECPECGSVDVDLDYGGF